VFGSLALFDPAGDEVALDGQQGKLCRLTKMRDGGGGPSEFGGEKLLPFAALCRGELHPDGMGLTDGHCDLVCFSYISKNQRPPIVVWHADHAQTEYLRWDQALNTDERVRYEDFTVSVAPHFDRFAEMLRAEPQS
jgi:hypothetical protein